jgi:hypothetical protein
MYDKKLNKIDEFNSIEECVNKYSDLDKCQINRVLK